MKKRLGLFAIAVASVILAACPLPTVANVTTGSWLMDQSNTFSDGVNYGQVDIEANDSTGVISFEVTPFFLPSVYETRSNFGIDKFGFNYADLTSNPAIWTFNLPAGWWYEDNKNMDGFGNFMVRLSGNGSREDPLTFTIQLPASTFAEAVASNFVVLSSGTAGEGNAFFAAHVAGFTNDPPGSHFIGVIPAPGAILLGSIGVGLVGWLRRRRAL